MPLPEPNDAGSGSVTFVNRFTLSGSAEDFEAAFAETAEFLCRRPGFRWHALLVPADTGPGSADAGPQYVNIAVWDDEASFRAAVAHPEFPAHAAALRALSTSEPTLYRHRQIRVAPDVPAVSGPGGRTT
ncbi:antibiotic biosynthesis monooxygenase family protein [Streptomyces coeruleorubidus]|jgi:monooxygenase|uniref:antibiotic biosynthesis monooxygenase family protein n=1 Tax=Streptomyces coeruleorubidus TaxID=116188 RepID=UPI00339E64E5